MSSQTSNEVRRFSPLSRWSLLAVLPLAGLLGAAGVVRADAAAKDEPGAHEGHRGPRGGHGRFGGGAMRMHRMLSVAGATDAQKDQIKAIFVGLRPQMQSLRAERMKVHDQLRAALAASTVDPGRVEQLRKQSVALADQQSALMTKGMVSAAQILTPEQRAKIVASAK